MFIYLFIWGLTLGSVCHRPSHMCNKFHVAFLPLFYLPYKSQWWVPEVSTTCNSGRFHDLLSTRQFCQQNLHDHYAKSTWEHTENNAKYKQLCPFFCPFRNLGLPQTLLSTSVGTMAGPGTLHNVQNLRFSFWNVIINYQ